mmetsp:Transcript_10295/g.10277  ORF Transcript_10295/g.10277 Transcript_10295/m.10277 type:complete len:90 (+) Transcript_10295:938-1207(+)
MNDISKECIQQIGNDLENNLEEEIGEKATGKTLERVVREEAGTAENENLGNEAVPALVTNSIQEVVSQELLNEGIELEGVSEVIIHKVY